jgi:serine/threonine-protein kinase RsbW
VAGPLQVHLPADPAALREARARLAAWLAAADYPQEVCDDVVLAVGEALANSIEHAYSAHPALAASGVEMSAELHDEPDLRCIEITIRDHGRWRPPDADPGTRGHGMAVIHALTDATVSTDDDGTTVVLRCWHP